MLPFRSPTPETDAAGFLIVCIIPAHRSGMTHARPETSNCAQRRGEAGRTANQIRESRARDAPERVFADIGAILN
jgi:hypothetical protein